MKKLAVSLVALGAMTSVALAEPAKLSDTQLDQVTAGGPLADLFRPIIAGALVGLGGGGDLQFQIPCQRIAQGRTLASVEQTQLSLYTLGECDSRQNS